MKHLDLARTPPMGWNSWDVFGWGVTESDVLEAATVMAEKLRPSGWEYVVVDGGWSFPANPLVKSPPGEQGGMDANGRYRPAIDRFPSSRGSRGFAELADQVHAMGLKFGIHAMRGVPRAAADARLPVLGTSITCDDLADRTSLCGWSDMMYGVHTHLPEAQTWYDNLFSLWASWGIDFVKMDDIASPYYEREIELVSTALMRCRRPMVLSLSPGDNTPVDKIDHVKKHAHLWRISADFWDRWSDLRTNFDRLSTWVPLAEEGAWPDADMLPLGRISILGNEHGLSERWTRYTEAEQRTLMTLWCLARSPLFFGGHLPSLDEFTLNLLTQPDLVEMNQRGQFPEEILRSDPLIAWRTSVGSTQYWAIFNVGEDLFEGSVTLDGLGSAETSELWTQEIILSADDQVNLRIHPHDCALLKSAPELHPVMFS